MTALRAGICAGVAGLLAGLWLGWGIWHGRAPVPPLVAQLDTVLVHGPAVHDTVRIHVAAGRAAEARAAAALERADSAAAEAARLGVRADSLAELVGDSARALRVRTEERDRLREEVQEVRAANRSLAEARTQFFQGMTVAEARVRALEPALAKARDALAAAGRRPAWAAGPVWEPGRMAPIGGALERDAGPVRLHLELTDGPAEPLTGRLGAMLRF